MGVSRKRNSETVRRGGVGVYWRINTRHIDSYFCLDVKTRAVKKK